MTQLDDFRTVHTDDPVVPSRVRALADLGNDVQFTAQQTRDGLELQWVSRGAGPLLGVSAKVLQTVPDGLTLYAHPSDRADVASALRSREPRTVQYRWRHAGQADAPWTWLRLDVLPVLGHSSLVDGRIQSAEVDHQLRERLAHAVDHETEALARLSQVEDLREHILRSLSHRVRTPLAILKACSETAIDPPAPLDEAQRDDLFRRIARATASLEGMVGDLLDLPSQQVVDLTDAASLGDLLVDVMADHDRSAWPVVLQTPTGVELRRGATTLRRCLGHLLENVVRHTPVGTTTTIKASKQPEGALLLQVADDGPGLPEHVREHLFEPFVTGPDGADPGLGIGLTVVQHLVTQQRGTVEVDSGPSGLCVSIRLPEAIA